MHALFIESNKTLTLMMNESHKKQCEEASIFLQTTTPHHMNTRTTYQKHKSSTSLHQFYTNIMTHTQPQYSHSWKPNHIQHQCDIFTTIFTQNTKETCK